MSTNTGTRPIWISGQTVVDHDSAGTITQVDTSLPLVTGPKRITHDQCHRVRVHSGVDALPALLAPYDARPAPPSPIEASPFDRGYPR